MGAPSAATLLDHWTPGAPDAPHRRLAALLAAAGEPLEGDSLGARNKRILALHCALVGAALEAKVVCAACSTENEFEVPIEAILALPDPQPDARVEIEDSLFRLPRMEDIEAAADAPEIRIAILERCRVGGTGPIRASLAAAAERGFEALDPAAAVVVDTSCAGCAAALAASVDVASFVAADLDRMVVGLFGDVDLIAATYGWSESEILALPADRRRRYVAMAAARRTPVRPRLAEAAR